MKNKDNHKMHLDLLNVISHLEENSITILITKKYNSIKKKEKKSQQNLVKVPWLSVCLNSFPQKYVAWKAMIWDD